MKFHEMLKANRGGLLRIKSRLFWYDGRNLDKNPNQVCLLLDADANECGTVAFSRAAWDRAQTAAATPTAIATAFLLIDGTPQRIWVTEEDVEILNETR